MYKASTKDTRHLPDSQIYVGHVQGSQKGCEACTRHQQRVQGSIRQPKWVQGMYKVAKRGVGQLPDSQKRYKACTRHLQRVQGSTRQPKKVQGMYKAAKRGAKHVKGIYKGCKDLLGSQKGYKACTR